MTAEHIKALGKKFIEVEGIKGLEELIDELSTCSIIETAGLFAALLLLAAQELEDRVDGERTMSALTESIKHGARTSYVLLAPLHSLHHARRILSQRLFEGKQVMH